MNRLVRQTNGSRPCRNGSIGRANNDDRSCELITDLVSRIALKHVALVWFMTLTATPVWGDGPVSVSLVHDPNAPTGIRMTLVAIHGADGEPIPLEPAQKPRSEPALPTMSVAKAMSGLAKLATLEQPFDDMLQAPLARKEEYALLNSIARPHDVGGLASMTALHHLRREYEKAGGDTFTFGRFTAELVNQELSRASASFLEKAYRSEFDKALQDPKFDRLYVLLLRPR